MVVEVTQNLTQVTISSVGIQGPKGEKGDSAELASTASYAVSASYAVTASTVYSVDGVDIYITSGEDINLTATDDINLETTGNSSSDIRIRSKGIAYIATNWDSEFVEGEQWTFNRDGTLEFPDNTIQTTAFTGPIQTGSFAKTGSNTFVGNQTISGSIRLEGDTIDNGINFGTAGTYIGTGEGALYMRDSNGYLQIDAVGESTSTITLNANNQNFFQVIDDTIGVGIEFTKSGSLLLNQVSYDAHLATTGSNSFIGDQTVFGRLYLLDDSNTGSIAVSGGDLEINAPDNTGVSINTYNTSTDTIYTWYFDNSGELILPADAFISTPTGDITIQPFDDLRLYGGHSTDENTEGGDVFIRGGAGPDEVGGTISTAGDVNIRGGNGGSGSIDSGGNGGNVTIYGGDSETEAMGGAVRIYGGFGYDNYGSVFIGDGTGTNNWEFNQSTGELLGPLWTVDSGTIYLDTSTQDQKIYFGTSNTASFIGTNFGPLEIYDSSGDFKINSTNVTITGSLNVTGSLLLNGGSGITFPNNTVQTTAYQESLITFQIDGTTTSTTGIQGANTILIVPAVGYVDSDTQNLGFTGRNVLGRRTLVINASTLCILRIDFGSMLSSLNVAPSTVVEVVYIGGNDWVTISTNSV